MAHSTTTTLPVDHKSDAAVKEIWKVTIILSVLTLIELGLGIGMMNLEDGLLRYSMKGAIIILMLAKAFYIVGYFMHLKHEIRNLIMTIVVPLMLFIWFILVFLSDGQSFKNLKNRYDKNYQEHSTQQMEKKEEPKKPGAMD